MEDDLDSEGSGAGEVKRVERTWKRKERGWLWWKRSAEFELHGEEVLEDGSGLKGRGWRRYVPAFILGAKEGRADAGRDAEVNERTALLG